MSEAINEKNITGTIRLYLLCMALSVNTPGDVPESALSGTVEDIKRLFKSVVEEAEPKQEENVSNKHDKGVRMMWNYAIKQYKSNLLKALGGK